MCIFMLFYCLLIVSQANSTDSEALEAHLVSQHRVAQRERERLSHTIHIVIHVAVLAGVYTHQLVHIRYIFCQWLQDGFCIFSDESMMLYKMYIP